MRQVAGTGKVAAVLIHFDAIVVEDIVVEAGEKSNLVLAVRLTIFAIAEKRVVEGYDPFETVARGAAEEQQRLEILVLLQGLKGGFDILQVVEVEADVARVLNDGGIVADGEDAGEGAVIEHVCLELAAVSLIFDGAAFIGAVFGVVADDVIVDINQVDDLVGVFVGDRSAEDVEAWQLLKVAGG